MVIESFPYEKVFKFKDYVNFPWFKLWSQLKNSLNISFEFTEDPVQLSMKNINFPCSKFSTLLI